MRGDDNNVSDYMPWWLGDYWRDTGDLDCLEHGAYLQLLGRLWSAGGYLPFDEDRLAVLVRVSRADWARVWRVIGKFFDVFEGRVSQKRGLLELRLARELRVKRTEAGRAGAIGRWGKDADANATASRSKCPTPTPTERPEEKKIPPTPRKRGSGNESVDFVTWYEAFPRKAARDDAWKAWQQTEQSGRPDLGAMLSTLKWQRELDYDRRPPDKVPYPATYLRKGMWKDEKPRPTKSPAAAPSTGLELYCDWHRDALNNGRASRRPKSACPECKHLTARERVRESSGPTSVGAIVDELPAWAGGRRG